MTIPFHNLATENNIVLFRLPPDSTQLTQPLDVGDFQPFKHYHTDAIDKAVWLGDEKFGKLEFLAAFHSFRNQIFRSSTIHHAFKSTGLVSFDSNVILDKIREKQAQRGRLPVELLLLPLFHRIKAPLRDLPLLSSTGRSYRELMPN